VYFQFHAIEIDTVYSAATAFSLYGGGLRILKKRGCKM
jgi:hypothetical protein